MSGGELLEIHLLEKTARHQNLDCSTLFEQMTKIFASAQKSKKYAVHVLSSICIFRPKCATARIASARQKIKKLSTARQYF